MSNEDAYTLAGRRRDGKWSDCMRELVPVVGSIEDVRRKVSKYSAGLHSSDV